MENKDQYEILFKELSSAIDKLDFINAKDMCNIIMKNKGFSFLNSRMVMLSDPINGSGVIVYTFLLFLIQSSQRPIALFHFIAANVLSNHLVNFAGSDSLAVYHSKILCELEPDKVRNWDLLLHLGANRSKILNSEEIRIAALNLFNLDNTNITARILLNIT